MLTDTVLVTCKSLTQVNGQAGKSWVMARRLDRLCGCPEPRLCKFDQHCAIKAGKNDDDLDAQYRDSMCMTA